MRQVFHRAQTPGCRSPDRDRCHQCAGRMCRSRMVFEFARPGTVVLTTPNAEYNVRFPTLEAGAFRHADHRFEWTRAEFQSWAERVAAAHGYQVTLAPVGPEDAEVGAPSQVAVFRRTESTSM